ncbi:MAG: TonB-dependent receptor [Saprospiraceae bacterium]|nr:TonB-dependent receptor [Saprospiraceae bacterium]
MKKRLLHKLLAILILAIQFQLSFAQGVTTSQISGQITDGAGKPIEAATIQATHLPSGSIYGAYSGEDGRFNMPGMRVGGPYKIVATYLGYSTQEFNNVELRLGENRRLIFKLAEASTELTAVEVIGKIGSIGENSGTSTQISTEKIENMPTINRDLSDFTRLTPQSANAGGGSSFGGTNNRYNAVYVDGAVNNDVFGLASSGTNGGQTGISPFSLDIIDQVQVILSPYDVTYGGFAGAGINAVTRSGTNNIGGTAYYYFQNQNMVGKTNKVLSDRLKVDRTKVADFTKSTYGVSLSGPIKKDKVFFFVNAELQDDQTPSPFEIASYKGNLKTADFNALRATLQSKYNYDPGTFTSVEDQLKGLKLFGKLDFNLNSSNKLTLRHSYTNAENFDRNASTSTIINYSNNGIYFPSITNSSAAELNTLIGKKMSNNLILGYTKVNDDRDPLGSNFPYVIIGDGAGSIRFGSEEFSTANLVEQDIFSLTDNFKIYKGKHTITLGTHNEFYKMKNVFIGQNFGTYTYDSLSVFLNNQNAKTYTRAYSLVDNKYGDDTEAAAALSAMQLGLYIQDEWSVTNRFSVTGGLRVDLPIITSDPKLDKFLRDSAIATIANSYAIAKDVEVGKAPQGQIMFSPRLGFSYALCESSKQKIRGGLGVFTSRIPFVWPAAMFNNNGLTIGRVTQQNVSGGVKFTPGIMDQPTNPQFSIPSGTIDLFTKDFKYPQVFRANFGYDAELDNNWGLGFEAVYTKTLNNIAYTNINSDATITNTWTGSQDNRDVYGRKSIIPRYSDIYLASNTSKGATYSFTSTVSKRFNFGLNANLSYTYGDAYALNEATSSQNSSQWRGQLNVDGRNNPVYGRSDFAIGHRVVGTLDYKINWTKNKLFGTTFSLFYDGHSGQPFSYVLGGSAATNPNNEAGSTGRNRSLIYIPKNQSDITLVDYTSNSTTVTAQTQWDNLNKYIESDPYLSKHRGQYIEKNANWGEFANFLDFAVRQDLGIKLGNKVHKIQLSADIFNFANLINPEWGARYSVPGEFNYFYLYQLEKLVADPANGNKVTKPTFTYRRGETSGKDAQDVSNFSSRWQARIGIRYIFN